ncbi:MAG: tRNA pseudouridine(13) synthase TruD [archaeon]|jgi:tRNA pseudouridine13 synthase
MNYPLTPQSFFVRELFNPQLGKTGSYYYYTLQKKGVSHKEASKRIGTNAYFCGIKDKNATTTQWFCTKEQVQELNEEDFVVKFKGFSNQRIHIGLHKGNAFTVKVELTKEEIESIRHFKAKNEYVCNYFGEQRFSENTISICRVLEEKNYESALKLFLTKESKFDSTKSRAMKKVIETNWGNWKKILEHEEIKDTGKVVLFEYLEKNPTNFEGAFLHAEEKSLKTILKAAQALRFNEKLNALAKEKKPINFKAQISEMDLEMSASKAFTRFIIITPTDFESKFRKHGLERRTFFTADKFKYKLTKNSDIKNQKTEYELNFELARGVYATVFLKYLESWIKSNLKSKKD